MPKVLKRPAPAEARRLRNFTESVIREQTRLAHVHGAVNLAQGFPDFPCDEAIKTLARAAIDKDFNQYSMTWGMPGLREAIAGKAKAYNGIAADPDRNVTVTCGATEAMISAFLSLVDPGREVIFFQPFYENYNPDAYLAGARPVYVTLREPDWSFDPKELAKAFSSKTAALVICNGGSLTTYQALAHGVPVLALASNNMDQHLNMTAVCRAGAGEVMRARGATPQALRATVMRMLEDPRYREGASAIAAAHSACRADVRFPELIEDVVRG